MQQKNERSHKRESKSEHDRRRQVRRAQVECYCCCRLVDLFLNCATEYTLRRAKKNGNVFCQCRSNEDNILEEQPLWVSAGRVKSLRQRSLSFDRIRIVSARFVYIVVLVRRFTAAKHRLNCYSFHNEWCECELARVNVRERMNRNRNEWTKATMCERAHRYRVVCFIVCFCCCSSIRFDVYSRKVMVMRQPIATDSLLESTER